MRWLALFLLFCWGWKAEGERPDAAKCVVIAAPHTSNWDFFFTICLVFVYRINARIMMKDTVFIWPVGPVLRWLGVIPIDRTRSTNMVDQSIAAFARYGQLALVVPPSGTRSQVRRWKTGFYHIAHGAGVPIALGFLDYRRKRGGFGPMVAPTGDIDADMAQIRAFYRCVTGKHPANQSDMHVTEQRQLDCPPLPAAQPPIHLPADPQ